MPINRLGEYNISPTSYTSDIASKVGGIGHLSDQMKQSLDRMRGNSDFSPRKPQDSNLGVKGVGAP